MAISRLGQRGVCFAHDEKQVTGGGSTTQGQLSQRVENLTKALSDSDSIIRENAALDLAEIGKEAVSAIPELAKVLSDSDSRVRFAAIVALANMGKEAAPAVPELIKALIDSDLAVFEGAAVALGGIGKEAKRALPKLFKALRDSNPRISSTAAIALAGIVEELPNTYIAALPDLSKALSGGGSVIVRPQNLNQILQQLKINKDS